MRRRQVIAGFVLSVAVVAVTSGSTFQTVAVALILSGSLIVVTRVWGRRTDDSSAADVDAYVPFVAGSWLLLMVMPAHSFVTRFGSAVTSEVGIQPLIELGYYTAVSALAVIVIRRQQHDLDAARPPGILLVLPIWVAATTAWGAPGLYSAVRAFQYLSFWLLAWASLSIATSRPDLLDELLSIVVRWFIRITAVLVSVGAVFGPIRVPTGSENADRFTWIAAHPNAAGLIMATAAVLLAAAPRRVTHLAPVPRLVVAAGLGLALYQNHSRTSWLCLVVGLLFVFVTSSLRKPKVLAIGTPFLALGTAIVAIFHWDAVWDYILRDGDSENLARGNGRRELWTIGFDALDTGFDWLFGLGYGITRTLFLEDASWAASSAHNSLLAMLVGTGVIGALLLLGTVGHVVWTLARSRIIREYDLGRTVCAAVLLMLLNAAATDVLAEPALGIGVLYLGATAGRAWRWRSATYGPPSAGSPRRHIEVSSSAAAPTPSGVGERTAPSLAGATSSASTRSAGR